MWVGRSKVWWLGFLIAATLTGVLVIAVAATLIYGIGLWGNNIPVAWAFAIINFVWWIGIGHAGTSSLRSYTYSNKSGVRASTGSRGHHPLAVIQAGLFPLLHLGRPWFFYWLIPYPATMRLWPQFRSALPWDAAAVFTYFTVSLLFWYVGLLPDFATLRAAAPDRLRPAIYGALSLGFRGSSSHGRHYRVLYLILAGVATPLVLSVHSIVSADFAIALVPGWHSTFFPPFFVAGAIFGLCHGGDPLLVPTRHVFGLRDVITRKHLDNIGKLMLTTGWIVIYSYLIEMFGAYYTGDPAERHTLFVARPTGPNAAVFWTQQVCNVLVTQLLWFKSVRTHPVALWVVALLVNVGMWSERFVIIVQSLQEEYLPSKWHAYHPTIVDVSILAGTMGFFLLCFLLFLRFVPFIALSEVKELSHDLSRDEGP